VKEEGYTTLVTVAAAVYV
jgi:hypothetical protein